MLNETPTAAIYTLSLHDALPISPEGANLPASAAVEGFPLLVRFHKDFFDFSQANANGEDIRFAARDRKSTRLNSSHTVISYAVFCLKKKSRKSTRMGTVCRGAAM